MIALTNGKKLYSFMDEKVILEQLAGDMTAFDDLFNSFITHYRFINDDIKRLLAESNDEAACLLAHSVANIAAELGINELESTAQVLEDSISFRSEKDIDLAMKQFSETLESIMQEIGKS